MAFEKGADAFQVGIGNEGFQIDAGLVAAPGWKVAPVIVDVGDAAAHAGGEVPACLAQDNDGSVGHVLAAVVANAFDDGDGAGVADGKAFAGYSVEECFAGGCAVEDDVTDQDAFLGQEAGGFGRIGDDAPA